MWYYYQLGSQQFMAHVYVGLYYFLILCKLLGFQTCYWECTVINGIVLENTCICFSRERGSWMKRLNPLSRLDGKY